MSCMYTVGSVIVQSIVPSYVTRMFNQCIHEGRN